MSNIRTIGCNAGYQHAFKAATPKREISTLPTESLKVYGAYIYGIMESLITARVQNDIYENTGALVKMYVDALVDTNYIKDATAPVDATATNALKRLSFYQGWTVTQLDDTELKDAF